MEAFKSKFSLLGIENEGKFLEEKRFSKSWKERGKLNMKERKKRKNGDKKQKKKERKRKKKERKKK